MRKILLAWFLCGVGLALMTALAATAYHRSQERTIFHTYLSDAFSPASKIRSNLVWTGQTLPPSRPLSDGDRDLIGKAVTQAWQSLAIAQTIGDPDILKDAFGGVALNRAQKSVKDASTFGGRMAVLRQSARPLFYHRDGSIFQAELTMLTARYVLDDDTLRHFEVTEDQGTIILVNEAQGWRVFSWQLTSSNPLTNARTRSSPPVLRGVNYYPSQTPWKEFWPKFDPTIVESDLATIRGLGANAVRIFLPLADFQNRQSGAPALANLRKLISIAQKQELYVIPTLFDLKAGYSPATWGKDVAYLANVLPILAEAPSVVLVDIKNEPDLDFRAHGQADVEAWLQSMMAAARILAQDLPMTIGWASGDHALLLADAVDVVTYHEYQRLTDNPITLARIKQALPDKPVMITEIGESSFGWLGFPGSQQRQAQKLSRRLNALATADGLFVWTLHDFAKVDPTVIGRSPWRRRLQAEFGLLDTDRNEKPAADIVRRAFSSQAQTYP